MRVIRRLLGRRVRSADTSLLTAGEPEPNGEIVAFLNACEALGMRRAAAEMECVIRARREPRPREWEASAYGS